MDNFTEDNFTEEELKLLKTIFTIAHAMVESEREDNYDVYKINTLYNLEEKLGIYDIV